VAGETLRKIFEDRIDARVDEELDAA